MKAEEFQEILIEGLDHTDDSRTEFYLIKAKEYGYSPSTFFLGLKAAYMELYKYVNSYCYDTWWTENADGTGKKIYPKKTINLSHLSNGKFRGFLDHKNILEFAPSLRKLENIVNSPSPNKWKPLYDGLIKLGLISASENFSKAMEERHLPPEKNKIQWKGKKSAAMYFYKQYNFSLPQFNNCFKAIDGSRFEHHNATTNNPDKKLEELISSNRR